ncbi:MAG TPA: SpoIID/LytB domain-containing protein [Terriglobales bacterium]|nr:SpoIID/LytB domain-containing protein [Terriglobales bacterium]
MDAAVTATEAELLWYEGRPAATYYSRSCGGALEDAHLLDPLLNAPYLRAREDRFCMRRDRGEWSSEISKAELRQALLASDIRLPDRRLFVAVERRSSSGRVEVLTISGVKLPAGTVRLAVGRALGWDRLRSDLYELQDDGEQIFFHGRGQGHGVGLCQAGAEAMGEAHQDYHQILAYYYPGTLLGINAQGLRWQALGGETVEVLTTHPESDQKVVTAAERALHQAQQATGWTAQTRPQIRVFPSIDLYRDTTGQPGWVAASTRGRVIRLQPPSLLGSRLDATLRHEFLHLLLEDRARPGLPLWFREGLVLWLEQPGRAPLPRVDLMQVERDLASADQQRMRAAYTKAGGAVAALGKQYGRSSLLTWVTQGVPAWASASLAVESR